MGFYIDSKLSFKPHLEYLRSKLSKSIFFLSKAKNVLPLSAMKNIYFSFIHSHLIYSLPLLCILSKSDLKKLLILQKKAVRIVFNCKYNAHSAPLFVNLKVLPIDKLMNFEILKFMRNLKINKSPTFFLDTWIPTDSIERRYSFRITNNFIIQNVRKVSYNKFPLFHFPKLWNLLDTNLKCITNKREFSRKLKKYYLDNL